MGPSAAYHEKKEGFALRAVSGSAEEEIPSLPGGWRESEGSRLHECRVSPGQAKAQKHFAQEQAGVLAVAIGAEDRDQKKLSRPARNAQIHLLSFRAHGVCTPSASRLRARGEESMVDGGFGLRYGTA